MIQILVRVILGSVSTNEGGPSPLITDINLEDFCIASAAGLADMSRLSRSEDAGDGAIQSGGAGSVSGDWGF